MQIEIDFDVFKALTAQRKSELDTYNNVVRRLLGLPDKGAMLAEVIRNHGRPNSEIGTSAMGLFGLSLDVEKALPGIWYGNVHFPEETKFRATYKGQTYLAEIKGGKWVDGDGIVRRSPSDAAGAISGTNVNGWRFWQAQRPGEQGWHRLDEFK